MQFLQTTFQNLFNSSSSPIIALISPQWDGVVFVSVFVTALFYGLGLSRNKIITLLLSTYIAIALVDGLSFVGSWWRGVGVNLELTSWAAGLPIAIFAVAFIFANLVLRKCFLDNPTGSITYNFLFSFLHVGFMVSIILSNLPIEASSLFLPITQYFFIGEVARFFWLVAPLFAIWLVPNGDGEEDDHR